MEQEQRYLEALGAVTAYRSESGTLSLLDAGRPRSGPAGAAAAVSGRSGPGRYSGSALRTYIMTSTLLGRPIPPNHVS